MLDEVWVTIQDFPNYKVSSSGRVANVKSGNILKESLTKHGVVKIGLVLEGVQYTRSMSVLVAETFVEGKTDIFNTPVHLDGNNLNNRSDNLVWRPRWFAWKYSRQFNELEPGQNRGPIIDLKSGDIYKDMVSVAVTNGLLVSDIWKSVHTKKETFPTWQLFGLI